MFARYSDEQTHNTLELLHTIYETAADISPEFAEIWRDIENNPSRHKELLQLGDKIDEAEKSGEKSIQLLDGIPVVLNGDTAEVIYRGPTTISVSLSTLT